MSPDTAPHTALRIHLPSEPTTLNPLRHEAKNLATSAISTCILHALNHVDSRGRYRPQLLAEPPVEGDGGLSYTYRLREDRRWHDGRPVTSEDVVFTHGIMMDPGSGVPERDGYDLIEGVEVLGAKDFRFHLARPYSGFRDLFTSSTGAVMPRHLLEGVDFSSPWDTVLRPSSGPFRLEEWRRGETIRLCRNDRFPRRANGVESIEFSFARDEDDQVRDVIEGRADAAFPTPTPEMIDRLRTSDTAWGLGPGEEWEQLSFRHFHPLLADGVLRQAIAWSVDRDALAATIPSADGRGTRLDSLVRRPHHEHYRPAFARYRRDVSLARKTLERAGYRYEGSSLVSSAGDPVRLRLLVSNTQRSRVRRAEMITGWLADTGIDTVLLALPMPDFLRALRSGDFDLALFAYAGNPDPVGHNTLWTHDPKITATRAPQGQNYVGYRSVPVTQLLGRSMTETDPTARAALFAEADRLMSDDLPALPILVHPAFGVWNPRVSGPEPYPYQAGPLWNVDRWTLVDDGVTRPPDPGVGKQPRR